MSVLMEDVSKLSPLRDKCDVHITEKCDSGNKGHLALSSSAGDVCCTANVRTTTAHVAAEMFDVFD